MALLTTRVSKCLDKKLKIGGFEIPDLLVLFIVISVLNFIFGQTDLKIFLVWMPATALACLLFFGKRGKPDGFLVHWVRFQFRPGVLKAFSKKFDGVLRKEKP